MVLLALILFGFIGYNNLPIELMPEVDFPFITVQVVYPGASPETVETEVVKVLEDEISTLEGIKTLQSWSTENAGFVFIEFELEYNINDVVQDVRDKISGVMRQLPTDIEPPVVQKFNIAGQDVMAYVVTAEMPPGDMAKFIDDRIVTPLQGVGGVGSVNVYGMRDREIKVLLDLEKMKSLEVGVDEVAYALRSKNVDIPGGRIETGKREYTVITKGEIKNVDGFKDIVIRYADGRPIRIGDIAVVENGIEDKRSLARINGKDAIGIGVMQQSGTNVVDMADGVRAEIETIREGLPSGIEITEVLDNSIFIRDSISDMLQQIFLGGIIATFIVLLFLRNIRTTIIAALAIPTSIISTFFFMNLIGLSFNMITLMALALSVGMLIDDAIVVVENIYRHVEMGKGIVQATLEATREVGLAVLATSMTMFAVFIPIAVMKGLIGRFMFHFGITVAFAVAVSLFCAFTLVPMLSSQFIVRQRKPGVLARGLENAYGKLDHAYRHALVWALGHKALVLIVSGALFIGAMMLTPLIGTEFQPPFDQAKVSVAIETEEGTSIEVTEGYIEKVENIILSKENFPEVTSVYTYSSNVNEATIVVNLVDRTQRERSDQDIVSVIRDDLKDIPGMKTVVTAGDREAGANSQQLQLILTGPDIDQLQRIAEKMTIEMAKTPGLVDVDTDFKSGKPEVTVNIDREKADDLGIDILNIATAINMLVSGEDEITQFKESGDQINVKMRLVSKYRNTPNDILRLAARGSNGDLIDLIAFATVETATGPSQINHYAKQREITVLANMDGIPMGTGVQIMDGIAARELEPGVKTVWSGFADIMAESFYYLIFALILAIVLIYMVLASQFEHFIHPLVIMFSLPLAIIGAFPMLLLRHNTINIMSLIGIITLMGLVTKNAILLVDFTNQQKKLGKSTREALLIAGPIRLRPILMTALSTMGGLVPAFLVLGAGGEFRAPMASAVMGGMITSTFLTLLVIPVVYTLFDNLLLWFFRKIGRERPTGGSAVHG